MSTPDLAKYMEWHSAAFIWLRRIPIHRLSEYLVFFFASLSTLAIMINTQRKQLVYQCGDHVHTPRFWQTFTQDGSDSVTYSKAHVGQTVHEQAQIFCVKSSQHSCLGHNCIFRCTHNAISVVHSIQLLFWWVPTFTNNIIHTRHSVDGTPYLRNLFITPPPAV